MSKKLFNKDFLLLWIGQSVSQLGNGAGFIAIMWWVQVKTGSAIALGTLAMVQTLVGFILSPFAGVVVDRLSRKNIIVITDLLRGIVNCLFAYGVWTGQLTLPLLFIGAGINSACAQFFSPAITASIPLLVSDKDLDKANSLRQMTTNIVNVFGYGLGGVLVALLGIPLLLLINGVSYLLSAFSELFIIIPAVHKEAKLNLNLFLADLKGGLKYVKDDTTLFKIMQVTVIINFCFLPFIILLPKFVEDYLGASSNVFGYISSAQAAGMLIATLIISMTSLIKNNMWLVKWGIGIMSVALLLSPFVPGQHWWAILLIYAIYGMMITTVNIHFFTALQRRVDSSYMGKVFSLINAMALGLQPLASSLSGIVTEQVGIAPVFIGCALLGVVSNILLARIPDVDSFLLNQKPKQSTETAATPAG